MMQWSLKTWPNFSDQRQKRMCYIKDMLVEHVSAVSFEYWVLNRGKHTWRNIRKNPRVGWRWNGVLAPPVRGWLIFFWNWEHAAPKGIVFSWFWFKHGSWFLKIDLSKIGINFIKSDLIFNIFWTLVLIWVDMLLLGHHIPIKNLVKYPPVGVIPSC